MTNYLDKKFSEFLSSSNIYFLGYGHFKKNQTIYKYILLRGLIRPGDTE